jgi:hypothetical protein
MEEMKMKYSCGHIAIAKSIEHAQRMYDRSKAIPTKDSKLVLEGEEIKMAKRPTKKKEAKED